MKNNENICQSLFYCFLSVSNIGFRNRAGAGLVLSTRSYFYNLSLFISKTFYDILFFMIIVIIMCKIIFGIILDSFRHLRGIEYKNDRDYNYRCFICNSEKDNLEKNSINFSEHLEIHHNMWDYAFYIISLRLKDKQDLNSNNSYVKEQIEKRSISWFPVNNYYKEK